MPRPNWSYITYLSTERVELGLEVSRHPELCKLLFPHRDESPEVILGHIAAWLEVAVDGVYSIEEIDKLCDTLTRKLIQKRTLFVIPTSAANATKH